jgi:phospholipase C
MAASTASSSSRRSIPVVAAGDLLQARSPNEHPGYADVLLVTVTSPTSSRICRARSGSTLVVVTYDENGGFWDHVAPHKGDRWGLARAYRPSSCRRLLSGTTSITVL